MKGTTNMHKLVEAEMKRDSIKTEITSVGKNLLTKINDSSQQTICVTLNAIFTITQAYKSFFEFGHTQFENIVQDSELQDLQHTIDLRDKDLLKIPGRELSISDHLEELEMSSYEDFGEFLTTQPQHITAQESKSPRLGSPRELQQTPSLAACRSWVSQDSPSAPIAIQRTSGGSEIITHSSSWSNHRLQQQQQQGASPKDTFRRRLLPFASERQFKKEQIIEGSYQKLKGGTSDITNKLRSFTKSSSDQSLDFHSRNKSRGRSFKVNTRSDQVKTTVTTPKDGQGWTSVKKEKEIDSDDDDDYETKLRFEVEIPGNVKKKRLTMQIVPDDKTLRTYSHDSSDEVKDSRSLDHLLQISRCASSDRKLKLLWNSSNKQQRVFFKTRQQKETFLLAAHEIKHGAITKYDEKVKIFIGTWNMGDAPPPYDKLSLWIPPSMYDLYVISTQESTYHTEDSSPESDWINAIKHLLGDEYVTIATMSLLAIRLVVFVKREHFYKISEIHKGTEATGIGNVIGNKGAVGVSFRFNQTKLCFVGSHLAARVERIYVRNENYVNIVKGLNLSKDFDITNSFNVIFWLGDLNYRITLPRQEVFKIIEAKDWRKLCQHDQMISERALGHCFTGFHEPIIRFAPTYRYNRGDRTWSNEKMRTPSYCDRILWRSINAFKVKCHEYNSCNDVMTSDHSPLYGIFSIHAFSPPSYSVEMELKKEGIVGCVLELRKMELAITKEISKSPSIHLKFFADFITLDTSTSSTVNMTEIPSWDGHSIFSFIRNKDWLMNQNLWVMARDNKSDIGQATIPLLYATADDPSFFKVKLTSAGLGTGVLTGYIHVKHTYSKQIERFDCKIVHSGFLTKEGRGRKTWRLRWFELKENGDLSYYHSDSSTKALNILNVKGGAATQTPGYEGKTNAFQIETPKRVLFVYSSDEKTMTTWMEMINQLIEKL
eukprot:CAMPEP_0174256092 /NCGR_PEP_ID=MMETSP0439-20130205/5350_1 /TAXON_ID=0 /ORGANISM="Stereomyxa ramosa, Strain Chinc5" /LENGTH=941 /DNA_ID=CAMNT_0015338551 /DNA_START=472 /DNA_END=3293 /DNA_ORIENTATION=+